MLGLRRPGLGVYPEADRRDYVSTYRDQSVENRINPREYVGQAQQWVNQGVQIVGGCCGIGLEYIKPLRDALPTHVPRQEEADLRE